MNKRTIALAIAFTMTRCHGGGESWCITGCYGAALASLELGDMHKARWYYGHAKRYLRLAMKTGKVSPNRWQLSAGWLRGLEVQS